MPADVTSKPGAIISTHSPQLLPHPCKFGDTLRSLESVAPTVIALGTKAGLLKHASVFSLPAATTTVTPDSVALSIAILKASIRPDHPKLILMTAGLGPFSMIQSMAPVLARTGPNPKSSTTFTAWSVMSLATPYTPPPTVPAQWVPWPCPSAAQLRSPASQACTLLPHCPASGPHMSNVGMARP